MKKILISILIIGAVSILGVVYLYSQLMGVEVFNHDNPSEREKFIGNMPRSDLLWSKSGKIFFSRLKKWRPQAVTDGENPRWSPDGSRIVFTSSDDLYLMNRDFSKARMIIADVVTEFGTGGYWTLDGNGVTAIGTKNPRQVLLYDLKTRKTGIIHDEGQAPFKGYGLSQSAEIRFKGRYLLTFTTDDNHRAMVVDLKKKTYIANELMLKGDCEPAWTPDGRFIVSTRRALQRPLYIAKFDAPSRKLSPSQYLIGKGRCHRAAVSNDSRYVLYASKGNIYCWKIGLKPSKSRHGIQLTFDGDNTDPSLFVHSS